MPVLSASCEFRTKVWDINLKKEVAGLKLEKLEVVFNGEGQLPSIPMPGSDTRKNIIVSSTDAGGGGGGGGGSGGGK